MELKKFIYPIPIYLLINQILSLTLPPFGILLGTPFIIPVIIWLRGQDLNHKLKIEITLWTILAASIINRTLDWFIAPGTHDNQGIGWMLLMTIGSVGLILFLAILVLFNKDNKPKNYKVFFLTVISFAIVSILHFEILHKYFNDHLGKTHKNLIEYLN